MPKRMLIPIGTKFGRLTVVGEPYKVKHWHCVMCQCECGQIKGIMESSLRNGDTKSCGCLQREFSATLNPAIPNGGSARNTLYKNYQASAYRKKLQFELSKYEFWELTVQLCHYCGKEPIQKINNKYSGGAYIYNGIDRKNNKLGYTKDNCVPCCKNCNTLKRDMSYQGFIDCLTRIYYHWARFYIGVDTGIEVYPEQSMRGVRK